MKSPPGFPFLEVTQPSVQANSTWDGKEGMELWKKGGETTRYVVFGACVADPGSHHSRQDCLPAQDELVLNGRNGHVFHVLGCIAQNCMDTLSWRCLGAVIIVIICW